MSTQNVLTASLKGNKRKSDAGPQVKSILESPDAFPLPSSEAETRDALVDLAQYVQTLQMEVRHVNKGGVAKKTPEELEALAERLRKAAHSGIKKQMTWKPSCKTGTAKWSYDGVCADPNAFAMLMGLDKPPTWKMKKITREDFKDLMGGSVRASIRYGTLTITSKEVNVKWNESSGEFKFSGSYGK